MGISGAGTIVGSSVPNSGEADSTGATESATGGLISEDSFHLIRCS